MIWIEQGAHRSATGYKHIYIAVVNDEYVAFVTYTPEGYRAHLSDYLVKTTQRYHYTADTLEEAKEWCVVELWKRRLT